MAEEPNSFGICECGDPKCKCKPGSCNCVQPSEKFLPKEDKKPITNQTINAPVNPTSEPAKQKGIYNALASEIPVDLVLFKDKQVAMADAGKAEFPFWAQAVTRLQEAVAQNIERQATSQTKFISKPCSWRIGKDGLREVAYNFIEEVRTDINISGSMASSPKQMVSYATVDKRVVLSKHIDDKSAMLAAQAYNEFLGLTK